MVDYIFLGGYGQGKYGVLCTVDLTMDILHGRQVAGLRKKFEVEDGWPVRFDHPFFSACKLLRDMGFLLWFKEYGCVAYLHLDGSDLLTLNGVNLEFPDWHLGFDLWYLRRLVNGEFWVAFEIMNGYVFVKYVPEAGLFARYVFKLDIEKFKRMDGFRMCPCWGVKHYFMLGGF